MITHYSKILFLRVVWKENGMLERGNPVASWNLLEIKKAVSSVSFLIDQDTLGCHSNQNSRDLRQYKFISCSDRVHGWCRVLSRAPGPHVLAGYSWLLQCNGISISTCISTTAKVKGRERAQTHPTRKYFPPRRPLASCFIGNSRSHRHT